MQQKNKRTDDIKEELKIAWRELSAQNVGVQLILGAGLTLIYHYFNNPEFITNIYYGLLMSLVPFVYITIIVWRTASLFRLFLVLVVSIVLGFSYLGASLALGDIVTFLLKTANKDLKLILGPTIAILTGYILYIVRLKLRLLYGFSEIAVGVYVSILYTKKEIAGSLSFDSPEAYLAVLSACIYLIVRGLDNMKVGITNKETNKLLVFLLNLKKEANN